VDGEYLRLLPDTDAKYAYDVRICARDGSFVSWGLGQQAVDAANVDTLPFACHPLQMRCALHPSLNHNVERGKVSLESFLRVRFVLGGAVTCGVGSVAFEAGTKRQLSHSIACRFEEWSTWRTLFLLKQSVFA
jgi:hypothetical protein